jgi:hypothetical protein
MFATNSRSEVTITCRQVPYLVKNKVLLRPIFIIVLYRYVIVLWPTFNCVKIP